MKPTLLVLAAGMGSRYGGLKQIDAFGPSDEAILEYSVYDALRSGFGKAVFILREDIVDAFQEHFMARMAKSIEVDYVIQSLDMLPEGFSVPPGREKPWGTAHAVLCAKEKVNTPFCVLNADDFYGMDSYRIVAEHLCSVSPESNEYAIVAYQVCKTVPDKGGVARGFCEVKDGYLTQIVERMEVFQENGNFFYTEGGERFPTSPEQTVSMNFFGFTPMFFNHLERLFVDFLRTEGTLLKSEFLIPWAMDKLIVSGEVKMRSYSSTEQWYGVTYSEDKPVVMAAIQDKVKSGLYPSPLFP